MLYIPTRMQTLFEASMFLSVSVFHEACAETPHPPPPTPTPVKKKKKFKKKKAVVFVVGEKRIAIAMLIT